MKTCAYCGRENQDEVKHCRECGTGEFIPRAAPSSPVPPALLAQRTIERAPELADPECDVPLDGEAALCTACLFPNLPESRWCKRCDAPMSSSLMFLMPDAARATGFVYRRAVETRPKLIVVCGIWLHFLPGFIISALMLIAILGGGARGWPGLISLLFSIAGGTICGSMLYRVTRNYFQNVERSYRG